MSVVSAENDTVSTFGVQEPVDIGTYLYGGRDRVPVGRPSVPPRDPPSDRVPVEGEVAAIDMGFSCAPVNYDDTVTAEAPIPGGDDYEAVGPAPGA